MGKIGKGSVVKLRVPSRFWKVIVARTASGVASYGFLLEQDLSDVPVRNSWFRNFRRLMVPLSDLQDLTGIKFPEIVLNADQYATNEGVDLAFRAGVKRRSRAGGVVTERSFSNCGGDARAMKDDQAGRLELTGARTRALFGSGGSAKDSQRVENSGDEQRPPGEDDAQRIAVRIRAEAGTEAAAALAIARELVQLARAALEKKYLSETRHSHSSR